MREQYADLLMSLSSTHHCLGDRVQGLRYAKAHFKQRIIVEDSKQSSEPDESFPAMAYTELALAWLLNNDYEKAVSLAIQGRKMLEQTVEFKSDEY